MPSIYRPLVWTDPQEILARRVQLFLYFVRIVDDTGFEYRYIGQSKNGGSRLAAYKRNVDRIFAGLPRRTTPGQEKYRAVHLAMARACELEWTYEFYPCEETTSDRINILEQQRIAELGCNLNNAASWSVQDYELVVLRDLLGGRAS